MGIIFNLRQVCSWMKSFKKMVIVSMILGLMISIAGCEMLGLGAKKDAPPAQPIVTQAPPKTETPPTPSTAAPGSAPQEGQPPGTPAPPAGPQKEVKPTPPPATTEIYVITLKNSHVRTEPDLKGKILTTLKKGTKVEKIGQTSNWVNVKLSSGETGYIFHELVKELE
jgi:uncharacterized protein YgiM (DUF1202 family)